MDSGAHDVEDTKAQLQEQAWAEINHQRCKGGSGHLEYDMEYNDIAEEHFRSLQNPIKRGTQTKQLPSLHRNTVHTIVNCVELQLPLHSASNQTAILRDLKAIDCALFDGDRYSSGAILVETIDNSLVTIVVLS